MKCNLAAAALLFTCAPLLFAQEEIRQIEGKLESITIPEIRLENASPADAIDTVRKLAKEHDPAKEGLKIGLERRHTAEVSRVVTLELRDAPVGLVLEAIATQANRTLELHPEGVVMRRSLNMPIAHEGMPSRRILVLDSDPFFEMDSETGSVVKLRNAKEVVEEMGVSFPDGATAQFYPALSILEVQNSPQNLDTIEAVFEVMDGRWTPKQIRLAAKVYATDPAHALAVVGEKRSIRAMQSQLRELLERDEAELVAFPAVVTR
ncbi:MAG: hypothetical protein R3F11_25540, partial [Verrucomicrobiales bacterium]